MPFMLKNAYANGEKRTNYDPHSDVPRAKSLKMIEIPPNAKTQKKRPDVAPLKICIYKVTDNASDVWSKFKDCTSTKLWQIQFDHDAIPRLSFQFGKALDEFLKDKHSTNKNYPKNRDELLKDGGVSLRFTKGKDPTRTGTQA